MRAIGEGIAFAGMCVAAAWMEVSGISATGLWMFAVFWAVVSDWGVKP